MFPSVSGQIMMTAAFSHVNLACTASTSDVTGSHIHIFAFCCGNSESADDFYIPVTPLSISENNSNVKYFWAQAKYFFVFSDANNFNNSLFCTVFNCTFMNFSVLPETLCAVNAAENQF